MPLKIEDVLALTHAGYTRAEIDTMLAPTQGIGPAPTQGIGPAPTQGVGPAPTQGVGPAPTQGVGPAPAPAQETDPFKRLAEEIVKGIQSNNRQQNNGQGQAGQQDYIDMLNKIL